MRCKALLKAALHDAAAVLVRADLVAVGHACSIDELRVGSICLSALLISILRPVRCLEGQKEGLDHMVAIWVRRQVKDVLGHLSSDHQDLLVASLWRAAKHLDESLDRSCAVQVHGDLNKRVQASLDELSEAGDWRHFDELLAQVVAELVGHYVGHDVNHDVHKARCKAALVSLNCLSLLEELLNHAAAGLVEGQDLYLFADVQLFGGQLSGQVLGYLINLFGRRLLNWLGWMAAH